jgi:hypothetical protein
MKHKPRPRMRPSKPKKPKAFVWKFPTTNPKRRK